MPPIFFPRLSGARRSKRRGWRQADALLGALPLAAVAIAMTGCGGGVSASQAKAGPISVAGSSGGAQTAALALASTLRLSMMPTGDKLNAGVDWTVTCGGNPVTGSVTNGACGSLTPGHTPDGGTTLYTAPSTAPINNVVTVVATVTSNPSQSSGASFTIVGLPVVVSFANPPLSSLQVNATGNFSAQVNNDPVGAGVIWTASCGSSACGSFNPATTLNGYSTAYTAPAAVPAGGTATVTATSLTDTTKSASATVAITPPPSEISVAISPASVYAQTTGQTQIAHFVAVVANDPAAAGVDWSIGCGVPDCGKITPHTASGEAATFASPSAVPPSGTVTVIAASTTAPSASASATANIVSAAPIAITITSPPPASLTTGTQAALAATVAADPNNLGVDWTLTCAAAGGCGSFSPSPAHTVSGGSITYTAPATVPAGGTVTITASSPASTPSNPATATTAIVAQPPSIAITQQPPATLLAATQAPVSATVMNDVPSGGVAWTVQCGSTVPGGCGWIAPAQTASGATATYTAPPATSPGTSVTVTATSVANPGASAVSNTIAILPATALKVSFTPPLPAQAQPNAAIDVTAAVANDASNAGIDWAVCASGCGFFTVKPAVPAIPATNTTPYVPPAPAVTATSVPGWSNGLRISYTAPPQAPSSGKVTITATAHADAAQSASGEILITSASTGPPLSGVVQAGPLPVAGASVSLFAAGTSGYASAASKVAGATSGKNGGFALPGSYTCPSASSQMYLLAAGGSVGGNTANPNLALMTALGNCADLSSSAVVVNEATTIASAFAASPFAANTATTGNSSYLYLGASSGNLSGLANAFAAVNNLVDITTGQARFTTPTGSAAVPYVEIDTLADMLNACAATSGGVEGDGSACSTLFTAADVLNGQDALYGGIGPSDTLQAAFNIAQHPVTNYGYELDLNPQHLLKLASTSTAFLPMLTTQPTDWSISLNYTGGGLSATGAAGSFAVDASGNLWITDTAGNDVLEWNAVGAALSPAAGFPAGGGPIAIDASGNIWISGDGALTELTGLGAPAPGSPFKGVAGGGGDLTIDAQGNLWIAEGAGVGEFSNTGAQISPNGGFLNNNIAGITAVGIDSSNNVWVGDQGSTPFAELTNPGGNLIVIAAGGAVSPVLPGMAADGRGNLWTIAGGAICEIVPYTGKGSILSPSCYGQFENPNGDGELNFDNPGGVAMDGAATAWLASQGGGNALYMTPPAILPINPGLFAGGGNPNFLASPSLAAGVLRAAVDGSGNVWVLLSNNTVTEFIGVAAPAVTPIALGAKNNKLGAKP